MKKEKINSFAGVILLVFFILLQSSKLGRNSISFSENSIPVITCRLNDTLSKGCNAFLNAVDQDNPLKMYEFRYGSDSASCTRLGSLSDLVALTKDDKEILLLVHGHYKSFSDAAISGLKVQNLYKIKVIAYSWPAQMNRSPGAKNYLSSRNNVELGAARFRDLLELMQEYKKIRETSESQVHLSLCLHSLGNYFLERIVKDSLTKGLDKDLFDNLIINAAAVNQEGHSAWIDKLNFQKRIYITSNEKDFNLAGVKSFTDSGVQLGRRPDPPHSDKAVYVDFTKAVGFRFPTGATHNYYTGKMALKNKKIHEFFDDIFHGRSVNITDEKRFLKRADGLGYELIP